MTVLVVIVGFSLFGTHWENGFVVEAFVEKKNFRRYLENISPHFTTTYHHLPPPTTTTTTYQHHPRPPTTTYYHIPLPTITYHQKLHIESNIK